MRILTEEQKKWCDIIANYAKKEIEPVMYDLSLIHISEPTRP